MENHHGRHPILLYQHFKDRAAPLRMSSGICEILSLRHCGVTAPSDRRGTWGERIELRGSWPLTHVGRRCRPACLNDAALLPPC